MKILNYGSLNIDYVYNVNHILLAGETLAADARNIYAGGKGLNQSVAFAKAGAEVWHAGVIGKTDGEILRQTLIENQIKTDFLEISDNQPSGHTFIQVDKNGQNCILVYGGSNQMQTKEMIDKTFESFTSKDYLILQNEINEIPYIMEKAHQIGMHIILNPSPFHEKIKVFPLNYVDFFMLNEIEAAQLVFGKTHQERLKNLMRKFPRAHIIMTLGKDGSYYGYRDTICYQPVFDVQVVDTTAAGDTFTGYFMKQFLDRQNPQESLLTATAASALAVSRKGAVASIPLWHEVEMFLKHSADICKK